MIKFKASHCLMLLALPLAGCVTLGPKIETKTVYVKQYDKTGAPLVIGTVDQNVKVRVRYVTAGGSEYTDTLDIGGFNVSPPELPEEAKKP